MDPSHKILVVDDEPDLEPLMLQRMRREIRSGKYSFVFAQNGIEALQRLGEHEDIELVLSDINMPQMDGLTLLGQVSSAFPNIRCVIISAYGDMKNIRTAMNRGAFDFVTKPLNFEDIQVTIERALRHLEEWRNALSSRDKLVALEHELGIAGRIQQAILPTEFPDEPKFQAFGNMEPARDVGGDFFDVIRLNNDRVGFAVADVSGKGVSAALFMMASRTLLKGAAIGVGEPGAVLKEVNHLLSERNDTMMFVTVLYAVYDPNTGGLTYSNGGHPPPLVVHKDGSSTLLPLTDGMILGIMPDAQFEEKVVTLSPGDMVFFYTDGVTEAMNEHDEEFGVNRLRDIAGSSGPRSPKDFNLAVMAAIKEFAGMTPQFDDITCLTLHCSEVGS